MEKKKRYINRSRKFISCGNGDAIVLHIVCAYRKASLHVPNLAIILGSLTHFSSRAFHQFKNASTSLKICIWSVDLLMFFRAFLYCDGFSKRYCLAWMNRRRGSGQPCLPPVCLWKLSRKHHAIRAMSFSCDWAVWMRFHSMAQLHKIVLSTLSKALSNSTKLFFQEDEHFLSLEQMSLEQISLEQMSLEQMFLEQIIAIHEVKCIPKEDKAKQLL